MGASKHVLLMHGGASRANLPCIVNFSVLPNGAMPSWFQGATWTVSDGKSVNTPTAGEELLTDGALENWASATNLTSWNELLAGTSTVNREGTIKHGGSYAARLDIDASNSYAYLAQQLTAALGSWIKIAWWLRGITTESGVVSTDEDSVQRTPGATWTQYVDTMRSTTLNATLYVGRGNATSSSIYADDISAKLLTKSTLYAYLDQKAENVGEVQASWNIATANPAGVVGWWDAAAAEQNCLVAYCDGAKARLVKFVGATRTQLIDPTAITYVAGAIIAIKRTAGTNTFQLFYNGQQVGTDQTVADAEIINNQRFGLFSTYEGNECLKFRLLSGTPVQFSFFGDSITTGQYPYGVASGYSKIALPIINHGASSATIMAQMAGQVTAAASDAANIAIIALGTNDDNAGNMTTLQAEIEEQIAALKVSNSNAKLYYLNVLPSWTDAGGETPRDTSNIRAAIAAACAASEITCWDSFTTPWITAADTTDGLHPNAAGHAKIATAILNRI